MNTRFKVLSVIFIFLISLVVIELFFSSGGLIVRRNMRSKLDAVTEEVKRREGDLNSLRYRAANGKEETAEGGTLVYSFPDDEIYDPVKDGKAASPDAEYTGLSTAVCLLYALMAAVLYALVITLVSRIKRRKK